MYRTYFTSVIENFLFRRKLRSSSTGGAQKVRKFTDVQPSAVIVLLELMKFPQAAILNSHRM